MLTFPNSLKDRLLTLINKELDINVGAGPFSDKYQTNVPGSTDTTLLLIQMRVKIQHLLH